MVSREALSCCIAALRSTSRFGCGLSDSTPLPSQGVEVVVLQAGDGQRPQIGGMYGTRPVLLDPFA